MRVRRLKRSPSLDVDVVSVLFILLFIGGCNLVGCVVMRLSLMHCVGAGVHAAMNDGAESLVRDFRLSGQLTGENPRDGGKIILAIAYSSEFSSGISISPLRTQRALDISAGT